MATLAELNTLINESAIADKVRSAVIIAAKNIAFEAVDTPNHTNRLKWSSQAFSDSNAMATKVARYVIAAKSSSTLAEILALSDQEIRDNVDASINIFANGS